MKRSHLFSSIAVLIVSFILFSCKKQISPSETNEVSSNVARAALTSTVSDCTPDVLGVYSVPPNGMNPKWMTLMQRFYNPEGTLTNIKAFISVGDGYYNDYTLAWLDLPWGVVTYHGNQVYVTDPLKNKLVMRVTLNDAGLPEATYYYNNMPAAPNPPIADTSYYYYTDNRLDRIVSLVTIGNNASSQTLNLKYDSYGNLRVIGSDFPGSWRVAFSYDYNKPVTGIITHVDLARTLKLLEFLGLWSLPMLHQPTNVVSGTYQPGSAWPDEIYPALHGTFDDVAYTDGGQVYSYYNKAYANLSRNTYYTGWRCLFFPPPGARMSNVIGELQDFKKQFPIK